MHAEAPLDHRATTMTGPRTSIRLHILRSVLFLAFAAAAGLPSTVAQSPPSAPSQRANSPKSQRLSLKARREIFETVWKDIRDHYYDPSFNGVNWDEVHTRYRPLVETAGDDQEFYSI